MFVRLPFQDALPFEIDSSLLVENGAARFGQARRAVRANGGFTLVELLVVIAILAILAALLLPALSRSRQAADSAVCMGNLRQWGFALRMSVDDAGAYPQTLWTTSTSPENNADKVWFLQLARYAGTSDPTAPWLQFANSPARPVTTGIHICPSHVRLLGSGPTRWLISYGYNYLGVSYDTGRVGLFGLGAEMVPGLPLDYRPIKESEVVVPGEMLAIGDALLWPASAADLADGGGAQVRTSDVLTPYYRTGWESLVGKASEVPGSDDASFPTKLRQRHGGRWNMEFCDGHVERCRPVDLFDVRRTDVLVRWNRDHQPNRDFAPEWWP